MIKTFLLVLIFAFPALAQQTRYDKVVADIQKTAAAHPQTTKIITVGDSDSGKTIYGLQIGNGPVHNLVVATHHGNEYGSTVVATYFAESMAAAPLQGQTLFVIPVLNISGYNANQRRESAHGQTFDPNRDYPGPCGTEGPFKLKSTAALAKFIHDQNIVASATLHTFSPAVLYPWGISTHDTATAYDPIFVNLGNAATADSHYKVGNSTVLLYPADGAYEDYAFASMGVWSMLFEMGNTHSPNNNELAELVQVNVPGLRRMFAAAPKVRAENHTFTGKCDRTQRMYDRHDE